MSPPAARVALDGRRAIALLSGVVSALRVARSASLLLLVACSSLPSVDPDAPRRACDATPGRAWCDARCVDVGSDAAHCGACGRACDEGLACIEARCERRIVSLAASFQHTCAIEVGGAVWCWGANDSGRAGNGEEGVSTLRPVRVPGVVAERVFTGYTHSCAHTAEGALVCWGANPHGELGTAGVSRVSVTPVVARGATGTVAMALGAAFSCATDEAGAALCWGSNEWGALGDGRLGRRPPVAPVGLSGVTAMGAGWGHVCALADGDVRCWGSRGFAQLGDGRTGPITAVQPTPVLTLAGPVTALVAGNTNACALAADGAVWCWGENFYGVTPPGDGDRRWSPERVPGLDATALYGGFQTWFARRRDGVLVGWGLNDQGQLGVASAPPQPVEVLPSIASRVVTLVAGAAHACALLDNQTVRCWGGNGYGELGNGRAGGASLEPAALAW